MILQADISRIEEATDIVELISEYVSLKKDGTTFSFVHIAIMSVIVYTTITEIHSQNTTLQLSTTAIVIEEVIAQTKTKTNLTIGMTSFIILTFEKSTARSRLKIVAQEWYARKNAIKQPALYNTFATSGDGRIFKTAYPEQMAVMIAPAKAQLFHPWNSLRLFSLSLSEYRKEINSGSGRFAICFLFSIFLSDVWRIDSPSYTVNRPPIKDDLFISFQVGDNLVTRTSKNPELILFTSTREPSSSPPSLRPSGAGWAAKTPENH